MEINENVSKKEIKALLDTLYPYKIELHAHTTPVSRCSQITPEEMAKTYSSLGYHAVVISNHFIGYMFEGMSKEEAIDYYMKDYEDCVSLEEKYNIKFYLAAEIRFEKQGCNDYLIYGCDRSVLSTAYEYLGSDVETYRKEVKLENSVFIQAHPFRDGVFRADPALLDGIETFNLHPGQNSRIGLAASYSKECGLEIMTAGSDFHHPDKKHEGVGAIRTKTLPCDSFELAEILKSGDYLFEVGGNSIVLP
ncbi:MAG: PHP domain-containing protein [Clostridia bacterium]|nr:PHP domain-containing protein [Clostridia bacterium]